MAEAALAAAPERFALGGFSMGGYVAFEILRRAPERVERLALIDTQATPDTPESTARRRGFIEQTQIGRFHGVQPSLLPHDRPSRRISTTPPSSSRSSTWRREIGAEGFLREQTAIMARPDSRPLLVEIEVPTVVIVGRQDQATPLPRAEEMAADIADVAAGGARGMRAHGAAGEAGRSLGRAQEMVDAMNTVYAREDYLGADEYIDVVQEVRPQPAGRGSRPGRAHAEAQPTCS